LAVRYLADENFNGDVLRGVRRHRSDLDVVRVQDVGLSSASDPEVLEWAAREGRIVITHDVSTLVGFAYERIRAGLPVPGVMIASDALGIGEAIDLIVLCGRSRSSSRVHRRLARSAPEVLPAVACSRSSVPTGRATAPRATLSSLPTRARRCRPRAWVAFQTGLLEPAAGIQH
jgi:hypothetical protein